MVDYVQLGRFGRNRGNLWQYPGANFLPEATPRAICWPLHPTVKPVAMAADAILDCTAGDDIVLVSAAE